MNPSPAATTSPAKSRISAAHATRHVYDVLVLGAQLSGTIAACLLAKRGYRVLHVDTEGLGATYEDKGYQLPWAPALIPSLKQMPQAEAALEELGVAVHFNRALDAMESELQLLFPRHRLDFPADRTRRAAEIGREFAASKAQILAALDAASARAEQADAFFRQQLPLPPGGFFERRAVKKAPGLPSLAQQTDQALASAGAQDFSEAVKALSRFLIYLDDEEAGPLARERPLGQLLRGARRERFRAQPRRGVVGVRLLRYRFHLGHAGRGQRDAPRPQGVGRGAGLA